MPEVQIHGHDGIIQWPYVPLLGAFETCYSDSLLAKYQAGKQHLSE